MANENPFEDPFADSKEGSEKNDTQHFTQRQQVSTGGGFQQGAYQIPVPDATAVLVLGIISIIGSFCYGIIGLILAIIGMALASRAERRYREAPERYLATSYSNLKAGKICSLIGLILSILMILVFVIYFVWIFSEMSNISRYPYY